MIDIKYSVEEQIDTIARFVELRQDDKLTRDRVSGFTEPLKTVFAKVQEADVVVRFQTMRLALEDVPNGHALLDLIISAMRRYKVHKSLADIEEEIKPIEWLWRRWIPRGMLTVLGAEPAAGKSYLALDWCRRIIDGGTWPDGSPVERYGDGTVIYVDAENRPQILKMRAQSWDMNRHQLYPLLPPFDEGIDFNQERWQNELVSKIEAVQPELVVVDSLSTVTTKGENSVEDMRELCRFLHTTACTYNVGMMAIHHLNKDKKRFLRMISLADFRGSSHIVQVACAVLGVSIIQTSDTYNRNGTRQLEVVKTNATVYPDPMGVEFQPIDPNDLDKGANLVYGKRPQVSNSESEVDECAQWLEELIVDYGPVSARDAIGMAEDEGYTRNVVMKARAKLEVAGRVIDTKGKRRTGNKWALPGQEEVESE